MPSKKFSPKNKLTQKARYNSKAYGNPTKLYLAEYYKKMFTANKIACAL